MKMQTDDYRALGDVSYEFWESELERVDSPLLSDSRAIYDAVKGHSALALAHMWRECQYETDRLVLKVSDHNPFNMKYWSADPTPPEGMTGTVPTRLPGDAPYLTFDSPVSAAKEWRKRVLDDPSYKGGVYTGVTKLEDYIETYAPASDFHAVTGEDNSTYYRDMVTILTRFSRLDTGEISPDPPKEPDTVASNKLGVILIAGHNSVGDGGNPTERALTPALAKAYLAAFKAAGIPATWINPTMYPGGLDGLASATARAIRDFDADLVLALDLHYNGARSGVHCIPAHNVSGSGGMLNTAIVAGRDPFDTMANNPLDVRLAGAYSKAIVAAVDGMYLWGSNGIMPENQTGVGLPLSQGGKNSRLAMMAYSAPYREKAVRLTVEHGGTNDAARPNFAAKCAAAVVAATKVVLADRLESGSPAPEPTPDPVPEGDTGNPSLASFLFGEADGYSFDPNGPVSKLWLATGNANKSWPRLIDVREEEGEKWFVFGDGSVIAASGGTIQYLGEVKADG